MSKGCYIGIDTSNYTTSCALVDTEGTVLANCKIPLPVKEGECGLRQSEAVFAHIKNLPPLMAMLREEKKDLVPLAVGVSAKPRDAKDSYMPCFLSGVAAAEAMGAGLGVRVYSFSHQSGHLMAALYSAGALHLLDGGAFGAFHVSGGTTEMLYVKPCDHDFIVEQVGGSADLHAGQVVDRIGVFLGLSFPCGMALEQLAMTNMAKVPKPRVSVRDGVCHLSGLENLAKKLYETTDNAPLTAAYTLSFIGETLLRMAGDFRAKFGNLPLLFAGGVMSNRLIAAQLRAALGEIYVAEPAFSADNAAGIALLCRARAMAQGEQA